MAAIQVPTAYRQLVKLVAHAFYGGDCPPKEYLDAADPAKAASAAAKAAAPPKPGNKQQPNSTSGLGIILLTALTERQWVKEDDLAADLHLHLKVVRKGMRYLEEEQLVRREHRKETLRAKKKEEAALQKAGLNKDLSLAANRAGGEGQPQQQDEEGEGGPHRVETITYCAIDYPRLVDMLTYRLAVMAQKAKKVGKGGDEIQQYRCSRPDCRKEYNSLQVLELIPAVPGMGGPRGRVELLCMVCEAPVELLDDGTEANRKARVASMRQTYQKLERALKPIHDALEAVKSLPAPDFDTYAQWLTHQVVLQQGIQQGPPPGSSGRSQYDRGPAVNLDNLQLVVDVGPAAGGSSTAAGRGLGSGAAANGGTATGRGGMPGGDAGRPAPRGLTSGGSTSGSNPATAGGGKAPPPWLGTSGVPGGAPAGNGAPAAAAAAGSSGAPLTQAQRQAAFLQQLAGGKTPAGSSTAAAPAGKPVPPWLMSSIIGGGAARPGAPRPALLGAVGLGAGLAAGLGGLIGLAAGLKAEGKPDMKRQLEAVQQQGVEEQERERKRLKPDPDYVKPEPQEDRVAAAAVARAGHEPVEAPATFDAMDDTEWVDVEDSVPGQQPAATTAAAPGPVSHPIDAGDDVEWEDL